jgi:GNAT superfamily N-acetyltransferase
MDVILQDTSRSALITAIEDNAFAIIPAFGQWPQAEVYDGAEIKWSITRIPFPMFNCVFRARLASRQVDSAVQSVIERARARNVPVLWWTGPQTQPVDLGRYLEASGFIHSGHEPGMAVDLMRLNEDWTIPPGLSIQRVSNAETLKEWCQAFVQGFEMPSFVADAFFDFMSHVGLGTALPYLGLLNGQPVATSLIAPAAGVAGVYNVATVPEARHKGIGTLMTGSPLRDARAMGYRVGILNASEMGVGVYRRLGFQEYCQIGHYVWSPTPANEEAA